ncbi:MAG: hypothetical protein R2877_03780 [Bdellovibrionota bacterium]
MAPGKVAKPNSRQKREENLAKKDLDDLFKPKISKEESKAWEGVMKASSSAFSQTASEFVDKFGYPKNWNDQIKLLDHNDAEFVGSLLTDMKSHLAEQTPTKKELFQGKLKVLLAACDDYALSKQIQSILASEFPS